MTDATKHTLDRFAELIPEFERWQLHPFYPGCIVEFEDSEREFKISILIDGMGFWRWKLEAFGGAGPPARFEGFPASFKSAILTP